MRRDWIRRCRLVLTFAVAGFCLPPQTHAGTLSAWNDAFLNAIRSDTTSPALASRNLAILHAAVYDAVSAIQPGYTPYRVASPPNASASLEAAVSGAAWEVGVMLFPNHAPTFNALRDAQLAGVADNLSRAAGFQLGFDVANNYLQWRAADGASTTLPYIPSYGPGDWRRTAPLFRPPELTHWSSVKPFLLQRADQFRPLGPPALNSPAYAAAWNDVRTLGAVNSQVRTAEQTEIARFWSDFSYTATPPGHWNVVAQQLAQEYHLSLAQEASLFALLNLTLADAAIASWDAKYHFNSWRPDTAIELADMDGNELTTADPSWISLLPSPPHPEYLSGHSTFSSAAATVLAGFFGTDEIEFTVGSDGLPGVTRTYNSLSAAVDEIGRSRVYGGIHFGFSVEDGAELGREIGEFALASRAITVPEPRVTLLLLLGLGVVAWRCFRGGLRSR